MRMVLRTIVLLALGLATLGLATLGLAAPPPADWQPLFDGKTFAGWRGVGRDTIPPEHWVIEDGAIRIVASGADQRAADGQPHEGGDIMTIATYKNFELELEWKVAPGANSGIKYNVSEAMSTSYPPHHAALGFEYQILDDDLHPDAQNGPTRVTPRAGAITSTTTGKRMTRKSPPSSSATARRSRGKDKAATAAPSRVEAAALRSMARKVRSFSTAAATWSTTTIITRSRATSTRRTKARSIREAEAA